MRNKGDAIDGGLLIDKDAGWTSHDVVARLRGIAGQRQVGHTGTLDPIATGLMICVLGRATRLSPYLTHMDKTYECEALLGVETDTYDIEGREVSRSEAISSDEEAVRSALMSFQGEIEQKPPVYSAIKVKGKRLYKYARANEAVDVPTRRVRIDRVELLEFSAPVVRFVAGVSAGAYIRSLCHDLGQALGCGAHMTALRRTSVGPFRIEDAATLAMLEADGAGVRERLLSMPSLLPHMPQFRVDAEGRWRLAHGIVCASSDFRPAPDARLVGETALVVDAGRAAVALVRIEEEEQEGQPAIVVRPARVFVAE